jgi:hypothetical protein
LLSSPFINSFIVSVATVDFSAGYNVTNQSISISPVSVPEPGTISLLTAGLIPLAFAQRRRANWGALLPSVVEQIRTSFLLRVRRIADLYPRWFAFDVPVRTSRRFGDHAWMDMCLAGKKLEGRFNLANRDDFLYPVLVGRNLLKTGDFLIDPKRKFVEEPGCK